MVSKARVLLVMLALLVLAGAAIALLAAAGAGAFWFQIVPIGILLIGAFTAQSLGLFTKKSRD
ncbi:hypothetical protein AB0F72_31255 [Actinoplanes sp. NPDC023936]|uniref:hypothetical protein n=1 Tax=Actinoplanes sp. NPDC023936 TaxID=3154910 RepID=UPI0033C955B8